MKGYDERAMEGLVDRWQPLSKLFGPYKTEVRKEIEQDGLPETPEKLTEKQYIKREALRRAHQKIREDEEYAQFRDEYDQLLPDATDQ